MIVTAPPRPRRRLPNSGHLVCQFEELEEADDGAADPQTEDAAEVRDEVYRLWRTRVHM